MKSPLRAGAAALLAGLTLPAMAAEEDGVPEYAATPLSGDWDSPRSKLWQRGLSLEAGLKLDSPHTRDGGGDGGEAGRDVAAFGRYAFSSGHATALDRMWNLGLRLRGPLASRPHDSLAMGSTSGRLAPKWRAVQAAAGSATVSAEEAFEITWRAAITPRFQVRPNFQHVRHPGGAATARSATLPAARVELTF